MIYLQLFLVFFKIGLFSFGGGYTVLSLIQKDVVERFQWITTGEFTEIVALSQVTPGPIAINSATYIGYKVTGTVFGSMFTTFGVVLPSFLVLALIIMFLHRFKNSLVVDRACLLYTSDAADDSLRVDLGGRRIIKKKNFFKQKTAYEISACLVGSEMCIRDSFWSAPSANSSS